MNWEGAELCYYINGESNAVSLTDTQFAIIAKVLGLTIQADGAFSCYSDDTLKQLVHMKGNPLRLRER